MVKAIGFIAAAMMLAASCTARQGGPRPAGQTAGQTSGGNKVLVAYFSCTGTTETAAKAVAEATGGTLYRRRWPTAAPLSGGMMLSSSAIPCGGTSARA